jgi:hypothetical protein
MDVSKNSRRRVRKYSGNRHYFIEARWTPTARTAIEVELITWAGDATQEPELALRQRNVLRASLLRYF